MKINYQLILVALLLSCQSNKKNVANEFIDTIDVSFTHFHIDEPRDTSIYQLVRRLAGDTTHYLYYYKNARSDSNLLMRYELLSRADSSIELIDYPHLEIVDTLYIQDRDKRYELMKYEVVNPPADGDGAVLFNKEYGVMATIGYGWLNREILTNWNGEELNYNVVMAFLSDSIARATKKKWLKRALKKAAARPLKLSLKASCSKQQK